MKVLRNILSVIVLIFILLAVLAPREFRLERDTIVNKTSSEVFESLRLLRNHDQWNAWSKKDPELQKEFSGTDGTVGFKASWSSENPEVGTAIQEIVGFDDNKEINTVIRIQKPFEADFDSYLKLQQIGPNQTKVTMGMADEASFPMNVMSFVYNVILGNQKNIAKDMDVSLSNMKAVLEQ